MACCKSTAIRAANTARNRVNGYADQAAHWCEEIAEAIEAMPEDLSK